MRILILLMLSVVMISCDDESKDEITCAANTVVGELSGLSYSVSQLSEGESVELQSDLPIGNGKKTFSVSATCFESSFFAKESLVGITCEEGFGFNSEGNFCESDTSILYESKNLSPSGNLSLLDLDAELDQTNANSFRVLINDVEVMASDVAAEISSGKIRASSSVNQSLEILSENYSLSASENDKVCFELGSENRSHCYFKNSPEKSSATQIVNTVYDSTFSKDLLSADQFIDLNFRGSVKLSSVESVLENKSVVSRQYQELNYSGLLVDAEFSLESTNPYRIEVETNGANENSRLEIILYRKSDFDITNLQDGFLRKFNIGFVDSSLRRKKLKFDFEVSVNEQAEEIVVLIYGENKSYVRDFSIKPLPNETAKSFSLFLTSNPNRSFGTANYVPNQYVPFGMPNAVGYGSFLVDDDQADYEIYTSYSNQFKTTGAHLYSKNDLDHDADLSWNFRGVGNSAPGGDSSDYLYGTKALDTGFGMTWSTLKTDPATGIVILHTEGGMFAVDGGFLKPYNAFSDETSEGGILETDTPRRFNNRVGKALGDRVLNVQNTRDPDAPIKDPMDLANNSMTYFPDQFGRVFVEDDGMGGTQLNAQGVSDGYDLVTEFLFYLFDDQGIEWNTGGPEGALAGTFLEQQTFDEFLNFYSYEAGLDSDLDGVSNFIEYITGKDPSNVGDFPFLDAYDFFDDQGQGFKAVTFDISKRALNFGINVYQIAPNGVETLVWSFDRGRGFESQNMVDVQESEESFNLTVLANGSPLEISDMRIEFN